MRQVNITFSSMGTAFFMIAFLPLFYLTPYGFFVGGKIIWLTDFFSIIIVFGILFFLLAYSTHFNVKKSRASLALSFLLLFFSFEFFFPFFGVVVWGDVSSASSSVRAFLYWVPFLLLFSVFKPSTGLYLQKVEKLIFISLLLNFIMGCIELALYFEFLPNFMNFRLYLADMAPQEKFLRDNIISFGFFQNSTSYAAFGYLALIHCLSRVLELDTEKMKYFVFSALSLSVIILSTSRTPLAAALISMSLCILFLRKTPWNICLSIVLASLGIFVVITLFTVDLTLFYRFTRLVEGGIENDYSLNKRVTELWPHALAYYSEIGHPTFVNPTKYVGTIDSGYLTYFLQGGWAMAILSAGMLAYFILSSFFKIVLRKERNYFYYFTLFLSIYCFLGMVISNPLRKPVVIAFLCFAVFGFASRRYNGVRA